MLKQEIHPSLVHFPIALLPVSLAAETAGWITGDRRALAAGRWGLALTAATGVVTGAAGFLAQQEVYAEGKARRMLRTHRNINVATVAAAVGLAAWRWGRKKPTRGSLLAGAAALAAVSYSAWLGGHMVYEHGVGIHRAGGARLDRRRRLQAAEALQDAATPPRESARASMSPSSVG